MNRLYFYAGGLFFDYRVASHDYFNDHFKEEWRCKEYWTVFVRLDKKWFSTDELYYDGHTSSALTIFGVTFGKSYCYDARPKTEWINN